MASLVDVARLRAFFLPERSALGPRPYAVVAAAGIAAGILVGITAPASRVDWVIYDAFTRRIATGDAPAPGIVVVAIDEPSFTEIGQPWPWPRALHAALIERLVQGGARTIVFDILFDVPSANREDDEEFADAIGRSGRIVLATDRAVIDDRGYSLTQWTDPIEALAGRAASLGVVRIPFDPDGVLRRAWLDVEGRPALSVAVASRHDGFTPPAPEAARLIRFAGPPRQGIVTVSYYQALDPGALAADTFKDQDVLIGRSLAATTIDEQADHFRTPVAPQMAGVEVHATILDNLLRRRFIADPVGDPERVAGLALGLGIIVAIALYRAAPIAGFAGVAVAVSAWFAAAYWSLASGVRLPIVMPVLALTGGYAATAAYRFSLLNRERRLIKRAFQHYVAPAIVDQMLANPSQLKLGGTEYDVTALFSDLEGFTTLSERLPPAELSAHLSGYFRSMIDVLLPEHGTLDKLIGDAIMMYFGCPIPDPRHAAQACRGALAMQRQMTALNARWAAAGLPQLRTRIGINSGAVVAGNMGTDAIFNYTILGDTVNLASRLEGVNKEYGTLIIIGEDTRARIGDAFELRELDWIRVKGKTRPIAIYELAGEAGTVASDRRALFAAYADALQHYRAGQWSNALDTLRASRDADSASAVLAERCEGLLREPPNAWDGVYVMKGK